MRVLIITNLKILLTIFFFINNFLFGLPKFTIKDGVSCIACHINPTGSGLRNDYGTNIVSIDALPLERWLENADENWDGYISENLQIGGDFRIQAIKYNNTDSTQKTAVFPMQADIYSYFSLHKNGGIYSKLGVLGRKNLNIEYWILINNLQKNIWLKIGKSIPDYGLRVDDHTSFIRGGNYNRTKKLSHEKEGLIFSVYNAPPSIIELGMSISSNIDWIASTSTSLIEQDETIGSFTSKLIYKNSLSNKFNYRFSLSYMKENIFKMYGIAGGISYGNIIWTYATDKAENWINNSSSLAIYDQISWQIIQGIHLIAKYDFFDPNLKLQNGAISRYTLGTEIYPLSILEIKIQLRLNKVHSKSNLKKDPEYLIQTHLYF